jgi:protein SCO1/2
MCSKKWLTNLALALIFQGALATTVSAHELSTREIAGHGGDFTLQSFDGPVSLEQLRGKVVLLFFGYTSCPDVCPATLAVLSKVFSKLEVRELERVTALFVTLDPERDTLDLMKKYTGYFHANIVGVTGSKQVIDQITADYGVAYERKEETSSSLGYTIRHTLDVLVVNQKGQLMDARIRPTTSTDDILVYLRKLLGSN